MNALTLEVKRFLGFIVLNWIQWMQIKYLHQLLKQFEFWPLTARVLYKFLIVQSGTMHANGKTTSIKYYMKYGTGTHP